MVRERGVSKYFCAPRGGRIDSPGNSSFPPERCRRARRSFGGCAKYRSPEARRRGGANFGEAGGRWRLASSIAHHVNNLLAAVTNLLFLLQNEDLSPEAKCYLATAYREISRVVHISTQALGFCGNGGGSVWASISAILDQALALHDNRIEVPGIELLRDYDATLKLRCHSGELRQVMVNLIGNALDAMPFAVGCS